MSIPLSLSSVPNSTPYIQYVTVSGQTLFPYPFPITQDSDLVVIINGVLQATDSTYALSGQGNPTGGNLTLNVGSTAGNVVTLFRNIGIQRVTQFAQNGGFSSAAFNAEFNNLYLIAQQLEASIAQCLQIPNTNNPSPTTVISPSAYASKYLAFDAYGNPTPALLTSSGTITASLIAGLLNPRTSQEVSANVTPTNLQYFTLDPLRYGAVGDGVTDDTAALAAWVGVVNQYAAPISSVWTGGKTYLCGPLPIVTVNDLTLDMKGCTIKAKPNSWPVNVTLFEVSGSRARISNGTIDGNQANWSAAPPSGGYLLFLGPDWHLNTMRVINSPNVGFLVGNSALGEAVDCHFDNNAATGLQVITGAGYKFIGCTFNNNGWLFQGAFALNGPGTGAFAACLRFRSYNVTFIGCESIQSGSDGFNVNQGCYGIKFIGCRVNAANDGGFTIAADSTSPGTPGDAESCYDIEYIDCEAYNCWASGIASFAASYNVTVEGGRYYNNGRVSGILAASSSFQNGIYLNGFGHRVHTKAYDDRQLCPITAASGASPRVLTATSWGLGGAGGSTFIATAAAYPRVALYNANMVFQGYCTISAESSGSVSVTAVTQNAVALASIVAGWYVSQRVQHIGCFLDNAAGGNVDIDGFGHLPGALGGGLKVAAGNQLNGQNVLLPAAPLDYNELLTNPTFDANVSNWTYTLPGGAASNYFTTAGALLRSPGCLQLIGGTASPAVATANLVASAINYVANGCFVEAGVWCYCSTVAGAYLQLQWTAGSTFATTVNHPGGGWKFLKIGAYMTPATTGLALLLVVPPSLTQTYWDSAYLRVKTESSDNRDYSYPSRNLAI